MALKIGQKAPNFTLPSTTGKKNSRSKKMFLEKPASFIFILRTTPRSVLPKHVTFGINLLLLEN